MRSRRTCHPVGIRTPIEPFNLRALCVKAFAFVLAFLVVIPAGNLLMQLPLPLR
jgi:hypothetical protein